MVKTAAVMLMVSWNWCFCCEVSYPLINVQRGQRSDFRLNPRSQRTWRNFFEASFTILPQASARTILRKLSSRLFKQSVSRSYNNIVVGVFLQDNRASFFRDLSPRDPHGESNVGRLECRSIVSTITCNCHGLIHALQVLHQDLLILGT